MVIPPPLMHDSAVLPCFHGCLAFLHRHSPQQSPPSQPLHLSLLIQQQPSHWDCFTILKFQLPATAPSRGPAFLSRVYIAVASCLILLPFRLPQISCFTLSLKCFSSDSDNCPHVGTGALVQFPRPPRAGPVLLRLLFFPLVPCPIEFCAGHNRLVPNRKRSTSRLYIVTLLI